MTRVAALVSTKFLILDCCINRTILRLKKTSQFAMLALSVRLACVVYVVPCSRIRDLKTPKRPIGIYSFWQARSVLACLHDERIFGKDNLY